MKKALFLIVLLLIPIALARSETIELTKDESFLMEQFNLTLLNIDSEGETVLLCVNGERGIVSNSKKINGLDIEVTRIRDDYAKLKIRSICEDCVCEGEDCGNFRCYDSIDDDTNGNEVKSDGEEKEEEKLLEKPSSKKGFSSFTRWLYDLILSLFVS